MWEVYIKPLGPGGDATYTHIVELHRALKERADFAEYPYGDDGELQPPPGVSIPDEFPPEPLWTTRMKYLNHGTEFYMQKMGAVITRLATRFRPEPLESTRGWDGDEILIKAATNLGYSGDVAEDLAARVKGHQGSGTGRDDRLLCVELDVLREAILLLDWFSAGDFFRKDEGMYREYLDNDEPYAKTFSGAVDQTFGEEVIYFPTEANVNSYHQKLNGDYRFGISTAHIVLQYNLHPAIEHADIISWYQIVPGTPQSTFTTAPITVVVAEQSSGGNRAERSHPEIEHTQAEDGLFAIQLDGVVVPPGDQLGFWLFPKGFNNAEYCKTHYRPQSGYEDEQQAYMVTRILEHRVFIRPAWSFSREEDEGDGD